MAPSHQLQVAMPQPAQEVVTVAGIQLEYTSLDFALQQLGMSQEQLLHIMAPSERWPFPGHMDGWKMAHNAIRHDMDLFLAAITRTKEQVDAGQPLQAWQLKAYRSLAKDFHHNVHAHHDHEEEIFFPWMETRVRVPEKMSADHKTLMALLDKVRDTCTVYMQRADLTQAGAKALLADLHTTFTTLRAHMRQHLEEEEIVGLPLLRKHFSFKEAQETEKKIVADLKPSDMAFFMRPMPHAEKLATMKRFHIPGLVQTLILLPAVRKDSNTHLRAFRELAAGQRMAPSRGKGLMGWLQRWGQSAAPVSA